jgi:2-iminobutanoate/2-iminopropanoate deaminase
MFSKAVQVGRLIFCTGIGGQDVNTYKITSKSVEEQVNASLDNIRTTLLEAGGSMSHLVKTTIFYKYMSDLPAIRAAELEYYKQHAPLLVEEPPARHLLQTDLYQPESLVEIEAIGVVTEQD